MLAQGCAAVLLQGGKHLLHHRFGICIGEGAIVSAQLHGESHALLALRHTGTAIDIEKLYTPQQLAGRRNDNFFRFEMIANDGVSTQQVIQLSTTKAEQAKALETRINKLLSGDSDIDAYALLSIIKKRLRDD